MEKSDILCTLDEDILNGPVAMEIRMVVQKNRFYNSAINSTFRYIYELKVGTEILLYTSFERSIIHNSLEAEVTTFPLTDECISKMSCLHIMKY